MKAIKLSLILFFLLLSKHSVAFDLYEVRVWSNSANKIIEAIIVVGSSGIYISDELHDSEKIYVQFITLPYVNAYLNHWVIDVAFFGGYVVQFLVDRYYPYAYQHLTNGSK